MDNSFVREIIGFYSVYIILGLVAILFNTVLVVAIARMKQLKRNRWLILSAALIAADTLLSVGYAIPAIVTMDEFLRVDNMSLPLAKYSSVGCVGLNSVLIFGSISDQTLTLCIAIDRAIAVGHTVWYRQHSDKLVSIMLSFTLCLAFTYVFCSFININFDSMILCTVTTGLNPNFQFAYYLTANFLCVAIVVIYGVVLILTRQQLKKLKLLESEGLTESVTARQLEKQIRVTKVISAIVFAYCLTSVPGYTVIDILPKFVPYITADPIRTIRTLMICQLLISLNTFLNSFLYTWRNQEIRNGVKEAIKLLLKQRHLISLHSWIEMKSHKAVYNSDLLSASVITAKHR